MDINKWLEDAAAAERPTLSVQPGFPAFLHPIENPVVESSSRRSRKRKQPSVESSFLAPEEIPTKAPQKEQAERVHDGDDDDDDQTPHSGSCSHSSRSAERSEDDSNLYRRRKRRKTRPDRYEPKPRKEGRRGHTDGKHKREQLAKKHDAKRSKNERHNPVTAVVRNFHAKNVPSERLTLRPRANLGIFKRGKASSPFRGRGLPDLVFSEMNFLQKRREPADERDIVENTKTKQKKDRVRAHEEEISAYFAPKRAPLVERSVNVPAHLDRPSAPRLNGPPLDGLQRKPSTAPSIRPTIELPVQPLEPITSREPRSASTTYFTWSESIRHSSRPAITILTPVADLSKRDAQSAPKPGIVTKVVPEHLDQTQKYAKRYAGSKSEVELVEKSHSRKRKGSNGDDAAAGYHETASDLPHRPQAEEGKERYSNVNSPALASIRAENRRHKFPTTRPLNEPNLTHRDGSLQPSVGLESTHKTSQISTDSNDEKQNPDLLTTLSLTALLRDCGAACTVVPRLPPHDVGGRTMRRSEHGSEAQRPCSKPNAGSFRPNGEEEANVQRQVDPSLPDHAQHEFQPHVFIDGFGDEENPTDSAYGRAELLHQSIGEERPGTVFEGSTQYEQTFLAPGNYDWDVAEAVSEVADGLSEEQYVEEDEEECLIGFWRPNKLY